VSEVNGLHIERPSHENDQPETGGFRSRTTARRTASAIERALHDTRKAWPGLSIYQRFEQVVSLVLTSLISLVIIAAVINLTFRIIMLALSGLLDPAETGVFQAIFGMIFTVLIALEFNHSIISVLQRKESVIQVRTVVLIALLALVRKFIILDASKTEPLTIIGLAVAILALGSAHWLVRDQDRKDACRAEPDPGSTE
jgi:uncharacterized membrane protein (DUF373 family)